MFFLQTAGVEQNHEGFLCKPSHENFSPSKLPDLYKYCIGDSGVHTDSLASSSLLTSSSLYYFPLLLSPSLHGILIFFYPSISFLISPTVSFPALPINSLFLISSFSSLFLLSSPHDPHHPLPPCSWLSSLPR